MLQELAEVDPGGFRGVAAGAGEQYPDDPVQAFDLPQRVVGFGTYGSVPNPGEFLQTQANPG